MRIGGDAPFVYMTDEMFGQLYDTPTLFSYGFDAADGYEQQIDGFLNDFTSNNSSVSYTSTALMKQQLASVGNIVLLVGGMIGVIMALAGLINFTNMMITNIITRRHEFATMQSIGMTNRQLRRMMIYEGLYYAGAADIVGIIFAAMIGLTVLEKKNRKYIQLQVSDVPKASLILERQFHVTDYAVQDEHNLRLYDTALDMAAINKALVVQDVAVISSQICNDTLEDYFKQITGGEGIA